MADTLFRRLAKAMDRPELAEDARFAKALERNRHGESLDAIIEEWTLAHPLAEIERVLAGAGIPATRIYTIADIFNDPHYAARHSIVKAPDRDLGTVAMAGVVPRLSGTPGEVRHAGRAVGEDTHTVLSGLLGYGSQDIARLSELGVIACAGHG